MGRWRRWLGLSSPEKECARELWAAYEALLPKCRALVVEPAQEWTRGMERPPLNLGPEQEQALHRELIYFICFLSTLHLQERLDEWRPLLDHLHAQALGSLPEGSLEELNERYGAYVEAFQGGMGRDWHAVGRLFTLRLQALLGDVPRALWSGLVLALLEMTRQAAEEVMGRLTGRGQEEPCPGCGRSAHLERVSFGSMGSVDICNACLEHPAVKERLLGDFAALFSLVGRGNLQAPELIRRLAARHRMRPPEIRPPGD